MSAGIPPLELRTFDEFLGACYHEYHGLGLNGSIDNFLRMMADSPDIRAQALARLAEINALGAALGADAKLPDRDYIAHVQKRIIEDALASLPTAAKPGATGAPIVKHGLGVPRGT